jgi:SAM-dependent methyltransferase
VPDGGLPGRENFALRESEPWQPPAFRPPRTRWDRTVAAARRSLDLQAASAWNDLQLLLADAHGDVLDVGAGAQPYRPLMPADARYRAIDVAVAGEAFGYEVPDTEYFEGDRWPVDDASVDVVLATETLEHVPEPAVFLAEARRVLRPGGRIVLTVPFAARWHYIPHDYWRYTPSSLRNLLAAAGFADPVVHARGNEVTVACYKAMALFLPGLFPPAGGFTAARLLAFLFLPLFLLLAAVGQLSLRREGSVDCLGWTLTAVAAGDRPGAPAAAAPAAG